MKRKKKSKRRDPYAQAILDRSGPYKPKIIKTKKREPSPADDFDDWYFRDYQIKDSVFDGETND